jgi:hypothetical protein
MCQQRMTSLPVRNLHSPRHGMQWRMERDDASANGKGIRLLSNVLAAVHVSLPVLVLLLSSPTSPTPVVVFVPHAQGVWRHLTYVCTFLEKLPDDNYVD